MPSSSRQICIQDYFALCSLILIFTFSFFFYSWLLSWLPITCLWPHCFCKFVLQIHTTILVVTHVIINIHIKAFCSFVVIVLHRIITVYIYISLDALYSPLRLIQPPYIISFQQKIAFISDLFTLLCICRHWLNVPNTKTYCTRLLVSQ